MESLDRLLEEGEEGRVEVWLIVDRLAKALDVFWAKAAKDRRLRREMEPTTDPVRVGRCRAGGSVVGGDDDEVARERVLESGTEGRNS